MPSALADPAKQLELPEDLQESLARWAVRRRQLIVEVRNIEGKSVMVSRDRLGKNGTNGEKEYMHALRYIVKLFAKNETLEEVLERLPNLRLQAYFDDYGSTGGIDSYGRPFDVDPESWSDIWTCADRLLLTDAGR